MEPTPSEIVHDAIDVLLVVVAKSAEDLRAFHDTVMKARIAPLPPFPRAAVATTQSVIDHLQTVDDALRQVLFALGLSDASA